MRPEELYLCDIVEAADAIASFVANVKEDEFIESDLLQSAVLQKLSIIGEAAARLDGEFKNNHPHIEWSEIIAFRNIAVHAYFSIEWRIVWFAALEDAPLLRKQIVEILEREYPNSLIRD